MQDALKSAESLRRADVQVHAKEQEKLVKAAMAI